MCTCVDPGKLVRGSSAICQKETLTTLFLFDLDLNLFYRIPMVYFKENNNFPRFQRKSNICKGGVQLFPVGSNCLFLIETHKTCDFPGGPDSCPPSGSAHGVDVYVDFLCDLAIILMEMRAGSFYFIWDLAVCVLCDILAMSAPSHTQQHYHSCKH